MHGHSNAVDQVIFGWDPLWVSTILFITTYAVIVTGKLKRAIVALTGANPMVTMDVLNQEAAIRGVDFNTLGWLTGMMVIVTIRDLEIYDLPYDAGFLFVFKARRKAHSWDYVTEAATLKTGQKTSKMGILFVSKSLTSQRKIQLINTSRGIVNGY